MFHLSRRKKPAHRGPRTVRSPRVIVPIEPVTPLGEGFMKQRPYADVLLPHLHLKDRVVIARYEGFPMHNGQQGIVSGISGDRRLFLVDLDAGGTIYCLRGELDLLALAATAVFPAVEDTLTLDAVLDEVPLMGGASR